MGNAERYGRDAILFRNEMVKFIQGIINSFKERLEISQIAKLMALSRQPTTFSEELEVCLMCRLDWTMSSCPIWAAILAQVINSPLSRRKLVLPHNLLEFGDPIEQQYQANLLTIRTSPNLWGNEHTEKMRKAGCFLFEN